MEPFLDKSKNVLGLDLSSNEFLLDSLRQSKRLNSPVITDPFTLVEGDLAYLIQRPVEDKVNGKLAYNNNDVANRYVILVVLAKSLFKEKLSALQDLDVTLYHSKFDIKDVKGHLHTQSVNNKTFIETVLFPKLSLSLTLNSKTQPFILYLEKQLGWNILDWWLLSVLIIVGGISFYVLINYARVFHISEMNRMQEADHLFYLANHDSLTGLANRYLLMDRLKHALNQAKRSGSKLAVIFMDLDEFKPVNDIYGHDFGDKLLKSVSERLLACIRKGDTLARRSGDEFILVLESVEDDETIKMVIEKIKDAFESNFKINQVELNVRMSIGFSIYPDDASDDDELLNIADQRMYKNKR
jgi:diguanylate cyclase (GGDEF)-like protein